MSYQPGCGGDDDSRADVIGGDVETGEVTGTDIQGGDTGDALPPSEASDEGSADGEVDTPLDAGEDLHDGAVDVHDGGADGATDATDPGPSEFPADCAVCHGDPRTLDPAPPKGLNGELSPSARGVGAHRAHRAENRAQQKIPHAKIACQSCHPVPTHVMEPPHMSGTTDVLWSGLAIAADATHKACAVDDDCTGVPGYPNCDPLIGRCVRNTPWDSRGPATTCVGVYCHGSTLPDGTNKTPDWTRVDGSQAACGTCHGAPPGCGHPQSADCAPCHDKTIQRCPDGNPAHCIFWPDNGPDQSFRNHINGKVETTAGFEGACGLCHGTPPDSGVHMIHAGRAAAPAVYGSLLPRPNATGYSFNCGYCHSLDTTKHMNCKVDVELYHAGAPSPPTDPEAPGDRRAIKGENPSAAYAPGPNTFQGQLRPYTDGTCSNVYCHSEQREVSVDAPYPDRLFPHPRNATDPGAYLLRFVMNTYDAFMNAGANTCCNDTDDSYPNFTVQFTRKYRTPKWRGESHTGAARCSHCHGYPPRQTRADANKMAGDSHGYFDGSMEVGHFIDMASDHSMFGGETCVKSGPVQCRRCHEQTVTNYLPDADWSFGSAGTQIAKSMAVDFGFHVDGKKDVDFDQGPGSEPLRYLCRITGGPVTQLTDATRWDYATRTCTNVSCHLRQVEVSWGQPMDPYDMGVTCNVCHQM